MLYWYCHISYRLVAKINQGKTEVLMEWAQEVFNIGLLVMWIAVVWYVGRMFYKAFKQG